MSPAVLEMARSELTERLGGAVLHTSVARALDAFCANPSPETARRLLEQAPELAPFFLFAKEKVRSRDLGLGVESSGVSSAPLPPLSAHPAYRHLLSSATEDPERCSLLRDGLVKEGYSRRTLDRAIAEYRAQVLDYDDALDDVDDDDERDDDGDGDSAVDLSSTADSAPTVGRPDLGLAFAAAGLDGIDQYFYGMPISRISRAEWNKWTITKNLMHDGREHAASFDFGDTQIDELLGCVSSSVRESVSRAIRELLIGETLELPHEIRATVRCRVAALERSQSEVFRPLTVLKVACP